MEAYLILSSYNGSDDFLNFILVVLLLQILQK